jgi:peptide subunit release factor RF-3
MTTNKGDNMVDMVVKNKYYANIQETGYEIDITTANNNRGFMHIEKDGIRMHSIPFPSNGYGTTEIKRLLPNAFRQSHLDKTLHSALVWIKAHSKTFAPKLIEGESTFAVAYNKAINDYGQEAYLHVLAEMNRNPNLKFDQLFRTFCVEVIHKVKTDNQEWKFK